MSRLNSKKSKAFHRLKHKNRSSFHFVCCLGLFTCCFIYVILVVGQGTIYALESLRNKNGYEFMEYREDEVIQLLGGPDDDSPAKTYVLGKRDLSSMERSLTKLLRMRRLMKVEVDYDENIAIEQQSKNRQCQRKRENATVDFGDETLFPSDLFTIEQRRHGAIILHFAGLVYMFIALAIVCDEFFVPSLGVITEALKISDDVAGATFMAAGGSAPEFFTSVFGVFITENNVGIGTIVGSATFNILCVLAFCCLFSKTVLHLTWWPLFRDMSFYVVALLFLVLFFHDEAIDWHEALAMFIIYIIYGFVMKYNTQIEFWVKSRLFKSRGTRTLVNENEATQATPESRRKSLGLSVDELSEPRKSIPVLHAGAMFRAGLAQMVLEEDDSIAEPASCPVTSRSEEQIESQPKVMNNGKTVLIGTAEPPKLSKTASFPAYRGTSGLMNGSKKQNGFSAKTNGLPPVEFQRSISKVLENTSEPKAVTISTNHESMPTISEVASFASPVSTMELEPESNGNSRMYPTLTSQLTIPQILDQEDEVDQPIDMSWPKAFRKQCVYVFLMPIMWPLYITLPDVKKPNRKKLVIVTFVGSVLWIAFYSYLMVWWANTIGVTLGIPTEVMGLTVLAAGTSIPDLITSVIVARKGLGDMAVSSSIGSNLFDICVGLPIPWLLFFASQKFSGTIYSPVVVISNGLICSVGMLFLMMVVLVAATAFAGWQMNKLYGIIMILSYIAFCIFSVFLEVGKFTCPLRVVSSNNC